MLAMPCFHGFGGWWCVAGSPCSARCRKACHLRQSRVPTLEIGREIDEDLVVVEGASRLVQGEVGASRGIKSVQGEGSIMR